MTILDAILQGILQGLTEFLPISSSGHLSLYQHFTGNSGEAGGLFTILLHFGTLLAVFAAFWRDVLDLIVEFFYLVAELVTGRFRRDEIGPTRRMLLLLMLSVVPLLGFYFLSDFYGALAADNDIIVEGVCFLLTGVLLFLSDRCVKGHRGADDMRPWDALAMGIMQGIAPLPGLSRSGSTIAVGLLMGLRREQAVKFSFLMAMPVVFASNLLEVPDALAAGVALDWTVAFVGVLVAAVFGFLAIWMVRWLVKTDRFTWFGWYVLALGLLTIGIGIYEMTTGNMVTFA